MGSTTRTLCLATIGLWVITLAVAGWFFVTGWTTKGADGRTEIVLAPVERDQILAEMRQLLKAVDGVVRGLGEVQPNLQQAEAAARAGGMQMAVDTSPARRGKLTMP